MISISDLRFAYPGGEFELSVPDLEVGRGEKLAVIGPSGSGKTTLLHLMAGIRLPQNGTVTTDGVEVTGLDDGARRDFRIRRIGMVFQEFELLEYLTVLDNILLPYRINGSLTLDADTRSRAAKLADQVGLGDKTHRLSTQLSHGEKQRVAVCRALVAEPVLLLADEPTGNLDPNNTQRVLDILLDAADATGATLVTVTHDHDLLPKFDRHVDVMDLLSRTETELPQIAQIDADSHRNIAIKPTDHTDGHGSHRMDPSHSKSHRTSHSTDERGEQ